MSQQRNIDRIIKSQPTIEGAGVHLNRVFGFGNTKLFDPFLLLDDFRSDNPDHYIKGFPWHPHRGIETITYMVAGSVDHSDSLGNSGEITAGDVQWMTAGSGIIHQEMPRGDTAGRMGGFQLWANLPASQKMTRPRYRDVKSDQIPEVTLENGTTVRIICGEAYGTQGPVQEVFIDPAYLDICIPPGQVLTHPAPKGHTVFAYVIEGKVFLGQTAESENEVAEVVDNGTLVLFQDGDFLSVRSGTEAVRFLLVSGRPLQEPVAWRGPIVMNTDEELRVAFEEYSAGTFIK